MSLESLHSIGLGGGTDPRVAKVLAELQGLKFSTVAGQTAGTAMNIADMEMEDTIAAIINLTTPGEFDASKATIIDRRASASVICTTSIADGDTVTVRGKVYTFKDVDNQGICYNTPPYVVPVAIDASGVADAEQAAANLAKAIMSGDSSLTCEVVNDTSSPPLLAKVMIYARTPGTAGNAYTLTDSGAHTTCSGATFSGGLATSGCGFKSTENLSSKTVLVIWYNKQ